MPSGTVDFFDARTGVNLWSRCYFKRHGLAFHHRGAPGSHLINVSKGDNNFLASSTATRRITVKPSIIALDPAAQGGARHRGERGAT